MTKKNIYTDYVSVDSKITEIDFESYEYRGMLFCDNIFAFDIETTSSFLFPDGRLEMFNDEAEEDYYKDAVKVSLCYLWSAAVDDNAFYGRTLESFRKFVTDIEIYTEGALKTCFIHNAAFEFQFMRNVFDDMTVFARKTRKPIYFSWRNYEFRCSYMLTRLSLVKWAISKELAHQKLVGDLDYNVMRTPRTRIKKKELDYSLNDVRVIVDGIRQYKDKYGHVYNIPLTQTGVVRKEFNKLMKDEKTHHVKMSKLIPDTVSEYRELVDIFGGGLTRSNRLWTDFLAKNVTSRDATSAYPWAMVSHKFPISKFANTDNYKQFMNNDNYAYIIYVELFGVESKLWNTFLSRHKCEKVTNAVCDNGRILTADYIRLKTTNIDYEIIIQSYKIKKINILEFKYALCGYLNNTFRRYILSLFAAKTKYKDVIGYEAIYAKSKEELNALFGMAVTKVITDEISFDGDWNITRLTAEMFKEKTDKQKRNMSKLNLAYSHGVWIPAFQRQSLWSFVPKMDANILYMDTDSLKYFSEPFIEKLFDDYNSSVRAKQAEIAEQLDVDISEFRPVSPTGTISSLGEYTYEGTYSEFITQGAKRYAYKDDGGKIHITVSGVNKEKGAKQLKSLDEFRDGFIFDIEHCGKMIMHYNDNMPPVKYKAGKYDEFVSEYCYGICGEPTNYTMNKTKDYVELLEKIKNTQTRLFSRQRLEK